jgi:hypothetical protein
MLYVATVHYRSPRWTKIQTEHMHRHLPVPHEIWTSLEHIDASYGVHFDRVLDQHGSHAGKLNHLAMEISQVASPDDLLMFIDGDAFLIADPMTVIREGLQKAPLIAVRRAENFNEPQPHPCFCVTTVRTWNELPGDWTSGYTWPGVTGRQGGDVGGNLLRRLELSGTPWVELLRTNRVNLDPLYYAVYGGIVYHHGAGFRAGELSLADREAAPKPLPRSRLPLVAQLLRLANRRRWRAWEVRTQRRHLKQSQRIFESIERGDSEWLAQLV